MNKLKAILLILLCLVINPIAIIWVAAYIAGVHFPEHWEGNWYAFPFLITSFVVCILSCPFFSLILETAAKIADRDPQ